MRGKIQGRGSGILRGVGVFGGRWRRRREMGRGSSRLRIGRLDRRFGGRGSGGDGVAIAIAIAIAISISISLWVAWGVGIAGRMHGNRMCGRMLAGVWRGRWRHRGCVGVRVRIGGG